ncbi:hypothetical protein NL676_022919 [Syzygium grande]|nr:hypothetical protein NL676_022919 [Syzygium grande]
MLNWKDPQEEEIRWSSAKILLKLARKKRFSAPQFRTVINGVRHVRRMVSSSRWSKESVALLPYQWVAWLLIRRRRVRAR